MFSYGTAANRPTTPDAGVSKTFAGATSAGPLGIWYYATDTGVLSAYVNGAWQNFGSTTSLLSITRNAQVAAAGSSVSDAAAVSAGFTVVTGANATKGVVLPTAPAAGTVVIIKNIDAANAVLNVYPDAAATINAIGSHGALAMAAKTSAVFIADSTTQWYTVPLLPS